MEEIRKFIDQLAAGENSEAKETIENILSTKSFDALEDRKKELASNIFNGSKEVEIEVQSAEAE